MLNFQRLTRCIRVLGAKVFAITIAGISGTATALKSTCKILNLVSQSKLHLES